MNPFEVDGESWELSPEGVETVVEVGRLFRETNLTIEQIAIEVGLDSADHVRLLWIFADNSGLLDTLEGL